MPSQATVGDPRISSRRLASLLLFASFGTLALVSSLQGFLARRAEGESTGVLAALAMGSASWAVWLLVAPLIVLTGRRFDFRRGRRIASALVHLLAFGVVFVVTSIPAIWLGYMLFSPERYPGMLKAMGQLATSSRLTLAIFIYAVILGLDRAVRVWQQLQERELQATRLEAQATRARLEALGSRLQPHFLFNTLQSVSALVDTNPGQARTMLAQLGDLLRDALDDRSDGEVTLAEEVALLGRYLDVEQTRFADRLRVEMRIAPDTVTARVPRFLLQPLAENALRYGLAPRAAGGTLQVESQRDGDRLQLRVWNDGNPLPSVVIEGVGLGTTRERLATRYGDGAKLRLAAAANGGVESVIDLPFTAAVA